MTLDSLRDNNQVKTLQIYSYWNQVEIVVR